MKQLLAITDRTIMGPDPAARVARLAARLGPRLIVQVREKDLAGRELFTFVQAVLHACDGTGARVVVNDGADVAACFSGRVGVHLPEHGLSPREVRALMGGALLGASVHSPQTAQAIAMLGVNYVTISPLFDTPSKRQYGPPLGLEALAKTVRRVKEAAPNVRVFGLGGITAERAAEVFAAGADGVAAIRAAWRDDAERLLG